MTLETIRKRLNELPPEPRWFFSRDLEYLDAAREYGINPDEWDSLALCNKGTTEEARIFNNHLSNLKASVEKQYYILNLSGF